MNFWIGGLNDHLNNSEEKQLNYILSLLCAFETVHIRSTVGLDSCII